MLHVFTKNASSRWEESGQVSEAAGARWRFHAQIMLGCLRNVVQCLYVGGSNSRISRWNLELRISWQAQYLVSLKGGFTCSAHCKWRCIGDAVMRFVFRGGHMTWRVWRVTLLAPRIPNGVPYVTRITREMHLAWQARVFCMDISHLRFVWRQVLCQRGSWQGQGWKSIQTCLMMVLWCPMLAKCWQMYTFAGVENGESECHPLVSRRRDWLNMSDPQMLCPVFFVNISMLPNAIEF